MNVHRPMATAMAITTCAVTLSVAACTVGVTSAGTATSPSLAPSQTASHVVSSPATSPSRTASASAYSGDTVSVIAPIGSFPIPHRARVETNTTCGNGKQILIQVDSVTPAQASAFYASALPRAGYTVAFNSLTADPVTGAPQGAAEIMFTGHGYTGVIAAFADLSAAPSASASHVNSPKNSTSNKSSAGNGTKNFVEISLRPSSAGNASPPTCSS